MLINALLTKVHTRLFSLPKLKSFNVKHQLLLLFCSSVLSGLPTFGRSFWGGNIGR